MTTLLPICQYVFTFFSFYIWGFRVNRYNCIILLLFFMSFAFQNYCPYFKVAISSAVVDMPHAP